MKAACRDRYGPPDVIELRDVDVPVPVDDEILVRVRAASVNRADLDALTARPWVTRFAYGLRRPRDPRLGADVATLLEMVERGEIVPRIDRRFPFAELVQALRYVDERRSAGKVVLTF